MNCDTVQHATRKFSECQTPARCTNETRTSAERFIMKSLLKIAELMLDTGGLYIVELVLVFYEL